MPECRLDLQQRKYRCIMANVETGPTADVAAAYNFRAVPGFRAPRLRDGHRPVSSGLRKRLSLALKEMPKCSQRLKPVADDLGNRQHGHRKYPARNTPHPEPEDEGDDHEDGIEGEPSGQKHRR